MFKFPFVIFFRCRLIVVCDDVVDVCMIVVDVMPPYWFWSLTLALGLVYEAVSHVALTFPPARKYDLDFLDNSRTKGPCGMPKGKC